MSHVVCSILCTEARNKRLSAPRENVRRFMSVSPPFSELSNYTNMKKTIIALMALAGLAQICAADAFYTKDDFADQASGTIDLKDVAETFSTGTFALSFELDTPLSQINSFNNFLTFTLGGSHSYKVNITCMGSYSMMTMSVNGKGSYNSGMESTMTIPPDGVLFLLQINEGDAIFSYYTENGGITDIMSVQTDYTMPDPMNLSTITIDSTSISNLTTWVGEVTAADLQTPTPAPSPSPAVPEPTTATLSLLALAGLAARRRRR